MFIYNQKPNQEILLPAMWDPVIGYKLEGIAGQKTSMTESGSHSSPKNNIYDTRNKE